MSSVGTHLKNLIGIPSVSTLSNAPIIAYAETALHAAEWQTRRYTYTDAAHIEKINLIAAPKDQQIEEEVFDLAFVCHTDTVPAAASWVDAFTPIERLGCIHGCGACDVKGFLACLLTVAQTTVSTTLPTIRIILTADEEIGCIGAKELLAQRPVRPARLVIGEPTSLHPARAGKGYCLARINVHGRAAHSAHPDQGASAILGAAHLLVALERLASELAATQNAFFSPPFTTLNIGTIEGGTAKNVVPAECSFLVEWRPIPGIDPVPEAIQFILDQHAKRNPRLRYRFNILRQQSGFETPAASSLVCSLESLSKRAAVAIPFGSEASIFAPVCEEIVVFGPGDMLTAHSERECVESAQLEAAVACLLNLVHE